MRSLRLTHFPLRPRGGSPDGTPKLSADEQRARLAAIRALRRSRQGRFDEARDLFADAARLDPALDLSSVPSFWELPRAAHDAAVAGYEQAGRDRDASRLVAVIRRRFRPRLVVPPPHIAQLRTAEE